MPPSLHCVLLIDDDPATNFLHRLVLRDSGQVTHIHDVLSADMAMQYLTQCAKGKGDGSHPVPDLILLDLNMPGTTGWQFLERLKLAALELHPIICILTTSANPADREMAESHEQVHDFLTKPLDAGGFSSLLAKHFGTATR